MKQFLKYFLRGLVLVAPLGVTVYVCVVVFRAIDGWLGLKWSGAGFVVTIALITLFGFVASNFLTRRSLAFLERVMERLPLVRILYSSTRDLLNAFVGERRRFTKAVRVPLHPGSPVQALGFVTQTSLDGLGLPGYVAVYFPQSYNFAGQLVVVPADQVVPIHAESSQVMAFIVSGGVTDIPGENPGPAVSTRPRA